MPPLYTNLSYYRYEHCILLTTRHCLENLVDTKTASPHRSMAIFPVMLLGRQVSPKFKERFHHQKNCIDATTLTKRKPMISKCFNESIPASILLVDPSILEVVESNVGRATVEFFSICTNQKTNVRNQSS